jgi:uncharacterized linocin/CFP29 family protein
MAKGQISYGNIAHFVTNSWRPAAFDRHGRPIDENGRLRVNAFINQEEWEVLDSAIFRRAREELNAWQDVLDAGLSSQTTIAEQSSKWRVASERIAADVTMDFRTRRNLDRIDKLTYSVPVPIISAEYFIGRRELASARALGSDIETLEAEEAVVAVVDQAENILVNGNTAIVVSGNNIPGYRTLAARDTATAAGYGGGDFGTISNIRPTFLGMLSALAALRYRGPFMSYVANTQYHQMLERFSDGSGQTALETVIELPQIEDVKRNDRLPDGNVILAQMTREVVDLRIALQLENRMWESPDGSEMHFVVLMVAVPRLKTDYAGAAGIAHATAA